MNSKMNKTTSPFSDEDREYQARVDEILEFVRQERESARASRQFSGTGPQAKVYRIADYFRPIRPTFGL